MLDDADKISGNIGISEYSEEISIFRRFTTKFSLLSYIEDSMRGMIDLAILRIDFSEQSGIEIAKEILAVYPHILILYMSDDLEKCRSLFVDMHPYMPFGVMITPFSDAEVKRNLERAIEIVSEYKENSLFIKSLTGYAVVPCRKIMYIESEKRILHIHMKNGMKYDCYNKIDLILKELPSNFLKIHQSYIINIDCFAEFSDNTIRLVQGQLLPVSRGHKVVLKEKLFELLGRS